MYQLMRQLGAMALITIVASSSAIAGDDSREERDAYVVTTLTSNLAGHVAAPDPILQNAWGIAFSPAGSPFWVNDNATGCSTLYDGTGAKITALQVSIPLPGNVVPVTSCQPNDPKKPSNPAPATPTGIVWNPSAAFLVPGTKIQAAFIFATEEGTISAWGGGLNPADNAVLAADESSSGAIYKGLAFAVNAKGPFLFATNFSHGTVDVFGPNGADGMFTKVTLDGDFSDPEIPHGYAPFNIVMVDGDLFVTYAKQNAEKEDDVAGRGHGFVDVFDTDGHLIRRFESRGRLNSPWGVARASFAFGPFSGKILIGNFGDGHINVFSNDGRFIDQLEDVHGKPLVIEGLWTLTLGGGRNSNPDTLYFSAGPNDETNGLFGTITLDSSRH
ncbi:MAG: TIGR03118 family protein [Steroidobacteraceae bacterium]